jgi:hypothetical protein
MRSVYAVLILSGLFASGCATAPSVRVDKDPSTDLTSYKTFGFYEHPSTDGPQYSTIVTARLQQATRTQLERLGYVYDEKAPQLRVNFVLHVADRQELRTSPASGLPAFRLGAYRAWGAYPQDLETVHYKAGTLSVDLVDAQKSSMVWHGVAEGRIARKTLENPGPAIDQAVSEMFIGFPLNHKGGELTSLSQASRL